MFNLLCVQEESIELDEEYVLFQRYVLHKPNQNPSYDLLLPNSLIKTDLDIREKGITEHFSFLN